MGDKVGSASLHTYVIPPNVFLNVLNLNPSNASLLVPPVVSYAPSASRCVIPSSVISSTGDTGSLSIPKVSHCCLAKGYKVVTNKAG